MRLPKWLTARLAAAAGLILAMGAGAMTVAMLGEAGLESAPAGPIPMSGPRPVPHLPLLGAEGTALDLKEFRGKVVLLNVWATWCVPCRREMPTLDRLQASVGGPDFEVVALSIDRGGLAAVDDFFSQTGVRNLRIYLDQASAAMRTLGLVGLPTTLLIDRDGREIGRLVGPTEWDSPAIVAQIRRVVAGQ